MDYIYPHLVVRNARTEWIEEMIEPFIDGQRGILNFGTSKWFKGLDNNKINFPGHPGVEVVYYEN